MRKIYLFTIIVLFWQQGFSQSSDQNYIRTRTFIKTGNEYMDQIQYYDGLGRLSQTVQVGASPLNGADLVSIVQYDGIGREHKNWLPVPLSTNAGQFVDTITFKSNAVSVYADAKPYSETRYEPSPLNRITDQFGAGSSWHNNNKRVTTAYGTNDGTIPYFFVNASNNLQRGNNYSPGTLYKTTITDEDGKSVTEFKDKLGRVVMVRKSNDVETYYVYNDLGQLSFVLPPLAVDALKNHLIGVSISDNHDALKKFGYIYKYDDRGNQTYKRLPGCNPVYMGFDKANRLVLSQDGNQRAKNQWTIYKYDILGRLLYTSEGLFSATYEACRDGHKSYVITETFSLGAITYPVFDTGYSKNYYHLRCTKLYEVNYYDNYLFLDKLSSAVKTNLTYDNTRESEFGTKHPSAKGLLTGTRTYLLDGSGKYITTAYYYDFKGQAIQTRSTNHLDGYDYVYNQYNFTGNVTKTLKEHNIAGQSTVTELYEYDYDHALRPTTVNYTLNSNDRVLLASNKYDELGRLVEKKRHSNADTEQFEYNIRGWATKIKSGDFEQNLLYHTGLPQGATACYNGNIAYNTWTYNNQLNGYKYHYDALNRLDAAYHDFNYEAFQYDKQGNITGLNRMGNDGDIDLLYFGYNGNQIQWIFDDGGNSNLYNMKEYVERHYSYDNPITEFFYDANGNMTADLDRDIVTIKYNLLNLPELIQFKNGCQIKHTYSAGGQKVSSRYVTVNAGVYQPLNPGQIIENLDVNENDNVTVDGMDYIGNVEYQIYRYFDWDVTFEPAELKYIYRIHNPEGFATNATTTNGPIYSYYRKDHLGNNREVWRASYTWGSTTHPAATVQRTQYYPSGLPWKFNSGDNPGSQPYKYGGKEFVEMHGLDEYDSDARWYYPAIMRTTTPDPLAEKYYDISPYAWCANNPVRFVDPDGRKLKYANNVSTEFKSHFSSTVKYMRDKGTDGIINSIHKDNGTIYIAEGKGKTYFDPKTNTIYWDPSLGVLTKNGTIISPATVFNHEADHANQKLKKSQQFAKDANTKDSQYKNAEEKRVITGSEQETARKHGEINENEVTRTDHKGTMYPTKNTTSTEGKYEVIVVPEEKNRPTTNY